MPGYSVVTAPTEDPVCLDDVKQHLRVDAASEDGLIVAAVKAATEYCEDFMGRQILSCTYDQTFDEFEDEMLLARPPLQSVTSVKYYDSDGVEQTLSSSVYDVVTNVVPGRIRLAYDQSWPSFRAQKDSITVRFVAGYGDDSSSVPFVILQAIKLYAAHVYTNRSAVEVIGRGEIVAEMPMACKTLLWSKRVVSFG